MNYDEITLEQAQKSKGIKWTRYDPDVIPSWIADMDYPVAEPISNLLQSIAHVGDLSYAPNMYEEQLVELFSERMQVRYGWTPDPSGFDCMTDIVQAIYIAVAALCKEDEQVIVQTPTYHPILSACQKMKREMVFSPFVPSGNEWQIDFDQLRRCISPRTKLFLLVNPHNPSGKVLQKEELESIANIVLENDLIVVSDEIHCDLRYSNAGPHIPFASISKEIGKRTVTFNSATKSHNLGGIRSAIAHYGSESLRARFDRFPEGMRGGSNAIGNRATRIAWEMCDDWLEYTIAYLESNRNYFFDYLKQNMPDLRHIQNQATFLAWIDCRDVFTDQDPADFFLEKARVATYSGVKFGLGGEGCIRMNFATSRPILSEKLRRMKTALNEIH
ncbi:MAG: aminotransferase class I/II-fold pyridoxal phosphate-dependent enzyme [Gammaproteobacteria bacterium]|nr:aminotransferase class I/II-fold pyridoxal phosphate-dependent enzyme [Gammaproteobacteria bacterium]